MLLFEAARAQLVEEVIRPSMEQGVSVVSDRFAASSIAYQGHGREIGVRWVQQINDFATQALYPHLNILLEVPPAAGLWRARAAQAAAMSKQERKPRRGRGGLQTLRGGTDGLPPKGRGGRVQGCSCGVRPVDREVRDGAFPTDKESFSMDEDILAELTVPK